MKYSASYILKRIATAYIFFLMIFLVIALFVPGRFILSHSSATAQNAELGEPVSFEWCRGSKIGPIMAEGTRTIILSDNRIVTNGNSIEYSFPFTIEDNGCRQLSLSPSRQPQEVGCYIFITNVFFEYIFFDKTITYRSNEYCIE